MVKRIVFVAAALLLSGIILAVALLVDSTSSSRTESVATNDQTDVPIEDIQIPDYKSEDVVEGVDAIGTELTHGISNVTMTLVDTPGKGQVTELTWDEFTPKGPGLIETVNPVARINLNPTIIPANKVVIIRADRGRILAPDGDLRDAKFRGNVIITFYEVPEGVEIQYDTTRDIQLRLTLDDIDYNDKLLTLNSAGPVHVTSPQVDFRGEGLDMRFSDIKNRLEKLEIFNGKELRIKPQAPPKPEYTYVKTTTLPDTTDEQATTDDQQTPSTTSQFIDRNTNDKKPQFYHIRFEDNVAIKTDNTETSITADYLKLVFALSALDNPTDNSPSSNSNQSNNNTNKPENNNDSSNNTSASAPTPVTLQGNEDISLTPIDPKKDIVITWTGRLFMEPELTPTADLAGPQDVQMSLTGSPVFIKTSKGETVSAAEVSYLRSTSRLAAVSSTEHQLRVTSKDGIINAQKLQIDQTEAKGYIEGPGKISAESNDANINGTVITWDDRLTLDFYLKNKQRSNNSDPLQLGEIDLIDAVKTANFLGNTTVKSRDLDIQANSLTIDLSPKAGSSQDPTRLRANTNVKLSARDNNQNLNIESQILDIKLGKDANNNVVPERIQAFDNVKTDVPQLTLEAGRLDVELNTEKLSNINSSNNELDESKPETEKLAETETPKLSTDEPPLVTFPKSNEEILEEHKAIAAQNQPKKPEPQDITNLQLDEEFDAIKKLVAEQNVKVNIKEHNMDIFGERLVITGETQEMLIAGSMQNPAVVNIDDSSVTGDHQIIWRNASDEIFIPGKGSMQQSQATPEKDTLTSIAWSKSMTARIDNGMANFDGNVLLLSDTKQKQQADSTKTTRKEDLVKLTANTLDVKFRTKGTPQTQRSDTQLDNVIGNNQIQFATAKGPNTKFTATTYSLDSQNKRNTELRLTLSGNDKFTFNGQTELINVIGPGNLLIEDYRPKKESNNNTSTNNTFNALENMQVTGEGKTVFTWQDKLKLDAANNTMLMVGSVLMIHEPAKAADIVQMNAETLFAQMNDTGGLGSWMSPAKGSPEPDIKLIRAEGDVTLQSSGYTIYSDDLQYKGADQLILLGSNEGKTVRVEGGKYPVPPAKTMEYNVIKDRFTAHEVSGGFIPIPER
ncbi:hypothetical protein JD969_04205 [Planctomycetota bacterium]|nr:hypothetical protein JD969_04205 [Planctomycetota bacterium]